MNPPEGGSGGEAMTGWLLERAGTALGQLRRLAGAERGQTMVEYAIVAALIAVAAMAAVEALGGGISTVFGNIVSSITGM
jgi:pilus assembly protein Flp/PilA